MKPFFWLWGFSKLNIYSHKPSTSLAASFKCFTDEIPFFSRRYLGMLLLVGLHLSTLDPRINIIGSFEKPIIYLLWSHKTSTLRYLQPFCVTQPWSNFYNSWSGDTNLPTLPPLAKTEGFYNNNFSKWMKSSITIVDSEYPYENCRQVQYKN